MTLFADDPGSLSRLHDIVSPPPVSWWPSAPAWYALASLALLLIAMLAWQVLAWWFRNRYRRAGLAEVSQLERASEQRNLPPLATLVKRIALTAYPRERVASLSGVEWLAFLDASSRTNVFTHGAGRTLEDGYKSGSQTASSDLFSAVRHWIKHHRTDLPC